MVFIPIVNLYYPFSPSQIFGVLACVGSLEWLRLYFGLQLFGQRPYETTQISALMWGTFGVCLVLWLAPAVFAVPLIAACALGDPLLGELRRHTSLSALKIAGLGVIAIAVIWAICANQLGISYWFIGLAPITVLAEWPNFRSIDDNALMLLVPLLLLKCVMI